MEYKRLPGKDGYWVFSNENTVEEQDAAISKVFEKNPGCVRLAIGGEHRAFVELSNQVFKELRGLDFDPVLTRDFILMRLREFRHEEGPST